MLLVSALLCVSAGATVVEEVEAMEMVEVVEALTNATVELSCTTAQHQPWFICVWESAAGARLCGLQASPGAEVTTTACGAGAGAGAGLVLGGNSSHCSVTVAAAAIRHHGAWTCALTDHAMDTEKRVTRLEVRQPGTLTLASCGAGAGSSCGAGAGAGQLLEARAGEELQLSCSVADLWPASNLTWSFSLGGQQLDTAERLARAGVELQRGDTVTSQQCAHCSLALQQRLVLTLQEAASGLVVRCAEAGSGAAEVTVEVRARLEAGDRGQLRDLASPGLGLVPGLAVSLLLVLVSLAVLVSFCIRGSRRRKSSSVSTPEPEEDPEMGKSLVENGIIKNKDEIHDIIQNVYEDNEKDNSFTDNSSDSSDTNDNNISDSSSSSDTHSPTVQSK